MKENTKNDLLKYRLALAQETLDEVNHLVKLGYLRTAVNRMYYACFYAVIALLLKHNIHAHTHSGVMRMLGLHFVKTEKISAELGKFYNKLFDERHKGDYDDFIEFDKKTVEDLQKSAKEFIHSIKKIC